MSSKHDPRLELSELLKAYDERHALRAENEQLHAALLRARPDVDDALARIHQAEVENQRLRAALTEISELDLEGDASLADALHIADEALNPPPLDSSKST